MSKKTPSKNDDDLFRQMMSDVKPLSDKKSAKQHIPPGKTRPLPKPRSSNTQNTTTTRFVPRNDVPRVAPEEFLFFARPGLQRHRIRQLKRGNLRPEAELDLHGYTLTEAATLLSSFLDDAQTNYQRCVCVIHGKGHHSSGGQPVLKAQINQWLRDLSTVLAFSSAQTKDGGGGEGAMYILLQRRT